MPREKNERTLNFKPQYHSFVPEELQYQGQTNLLHEEIEAIYLMDVLDLYQEDAAKSMQVSRPTFTRIIKNARKKLANALICGHKINIHDDKKDFVVMFCCDDIEKTTHFDPQAKFLYIYHINDETSTLIKKLGNPAYESDIKPTLSLMPLVLEHHANFFIGNKIGEGFKNSLIAKGIQPLIIEKLEIEKLPYILK